MINTINVIHKDLDDKFSDLANKVKRIEQKNTDLTFLPKDPKKSYDSRILQLESKIKEIEKKCDTNESKVKEVEGKSNKYALQKEIESMILNQSTKIDSFNMELKKYIQENIKKVENVINLENQKNSNEIKKNIQNLEKKHDNDIKKLDARMTENENGILRVK